MLDTTDQIVLCVATAILAACCAARSIIVVRFGAIAAGLPITAYGVVSQAWPVVGAQALLVCVNAWRLLETYRLYDRVRSVREDTIGIGDFEAHFRRERHARGDTLFLKGNPGSYAYYVASGEISIPEFSASVGPGEFFGEFSLFTDDGLRTASAVCRSDVELYRIDADALAATFHRTPDFAFALVRLIVQRMNRNNDRLHQENAKLRIDRQIAGPRVL